MLLYLENQLQMLVQYGSVQPIRRQRVHNEARREFEMSPIAIIASGKPGRVTERIVFLES
jgi:hypothetical protein